MKNLGREYVAGVPVEAPRKGSKYVCRTCGFETDDETGGVHKKSDAIGDFCYTLPLERDPDPGAAA